MPYTNFQKDEAKVELIKKIENWLREIFNLVDSIDIFIIDLRLHDDDFSEQDFQNLSGIQIIKFLKKYNPGIQVVVSTASNKVWNYQKCLDLGVKYFSVKESPETYNTRSETIASYNHFSNQLSNAVKDIFLAVIFRKIEDLKNNNIFSKITLEKDKKSANLIIEKNGLLDQIFNLLRLDNSDEAIIHQCLLIAFQILENYCELGMVGNFGSDNSSGNRLSSGSIWAKAVQSIFS
jgi:DNA-binding NarL/FixJ family response regulator